MDPSTEVTSTAAPVATSAEPVATPALAPQDKASKRAAIVKSVRAAQAAAAVEPEPAAVTPKPATTATPAATVAPVAVATPDTGLTDRLAALERELNDTRSKLTEREKVRAAPSDVEGILDLMSENPDMTIEKISELYLKRQDNPAHKELSAAEKRLAAIEAKIAAGEKAEKDRADRAAGATAEADGLKVARGIIDEGKSRWPRLTRDERNITEAIPEAADRAFKMLGGKEASPEKRRELFMAALDEVEKDRAERATRYSMPDIPARRTITATAGSNGTLPQPKPDSEQPLSKEDRKRKILARVRAGQPKTTD